nr:G5 domain-containing protein [Streptococcus sp. Marseille-Q5986]
MTRENPQLPKGPSQIVVVGVNGRHTIFYSVSTTADSKEERTLVNGAVSQEGVAQVVEVGTAVEKAEQAKPTIAKAEEKQLPATESPDSAGLVAVGLMATLAAYGLSKKKED